MINLILDVHNVAWRSYYAKGYSWMNSSRGISAHIYGSIKQLISIINKCTSDFNSDKFNIVFAYDRYPKRKLKQDPEYKGTRKKPKFSPISDVKTLFNMIPSEIIYVEDEECDDTIASYINKNNKLNIINSTDTDLWQLLNYSNVKILTHQKYVTEENVIKKYKLPLDHCYKIPLYKSLFGDTGDNIPNLGSRLQWKVLEPLFLKCNGDSDNFMVLAKEMLLDKHYNKLLLKKDRFELNFKLANLDKNLDYVSIQNDGDRTRLEKFLINWGCQSIIKDLNILFP